MINRDRIEFDRSPKQTLTFIFRLKQIRENNFQVREKLQNGTTQI